MKTTTNRIRRNGKAAGAAQQEKPQPLPPGKRAALDPVTVAFFDKDTGKELWRAEMKGELYALVEIAAKREGLNPGDLMLRAMDEKISKAKRGELPRAFVDPECHARFLAAREGA